MLRKEKILKEKKFRVKINYFSGREE